MIGWIIGFVVIVWLLSYFCTPWHKDFTGPR